MSNTYCQIYIHIVFAVKFRQGLINESIREEFEKYISGIIRNESQKLLAIYCMPDHCHLFISMTADKPVSDVVRVVKASSSKWINERNKLPGRFEWQSGYGAFIYSQSQIASVVNYILNQEGHHKMKNFREEYIELLTKFKIEYDKRYIFEEPI
jgi:putative transposase